MDRPETAAARAALTSLIVLQLVMLAALYAGVAPHPPASVPLFGIAPFLGAALAAAGAALCLGPAATGAGRASSIIAALMAVLSFGPQKYLDPQFPLIWPAVLAGQVAIVVLCVAVLRARRPVDA